MENRIQKIHVNYSEYCYFDYLPPYEKIEYLFQLYEGRQVSENIDLTSFFKQVASDINEIESSAHETYDIEDDHEKVEVMIDDEFIMIESDSLKSVKLVITKFIEAGYLVQRDKQSEKMFKRDKLTRYLRVYTIVGRELGFGLS